MLQLPALLRIFQNFPEYVAAVISRIITGTYFLERILSISFYLFWAHFKSMFYFISILLTVCINPLADALPSIAWSYNFTKVISQYNCIILIIVLLLLVVVLLLSLVLYPDHFSEVPVKSCSEKKSILWIWSNHRPFASSSSSLLFFLLLLSLSLLLFCYFPFY